VGSKSSVEVVLDYKSTIPQLCCSTNIGIFCLDCFFPQIPECACVGSNWRTVFRWDEAVLCEAAV
jgi:hypothetical protein